MNIFQKVTLKNLKENRTRTLVTIVGIILSAAMFTATTVSISSLQHYLVQSAIFNSGNWYGAAYGISAEEREQLLAKWSRPSQWNFWAIPPWKAA